jgi:hypothetical protein
MWVTFKACVRCVSMFGADFSNGTVSSHVNRTQATTGQAQVFFSFCSKDICMHAGLYARTHTHTHTHTHTSLREPFRTQSAARGTWRKRFYSWPIRLWRLDVGRVQFQRAGAMRQVIYIQAHTHTHAHAHTHTHTHTHTHVMLIMSIAPFGESEENTQTHTCTYTHTGVLPLPCTLEEATPMESWRRRPWAWEVAICSSPVTRSIRGRKVSVLLRKNYVIVFW